MFFRLGRSVARHPWRVIGAWVVAGSGSHDGSVHGTDGSPHTGALLRAGVVCARKELHEALEEAPSRLEHRGVACRRVVCQDPDQFFVVRDEVHVLGNELAPGRPRAGRLGPSEESLEPVQGGSDERF